MAEEEFVVSENERDNSEIQKESGKEWGTAVKNVSHWRINQDGRVGWGRM